MILTPDERHALARQPLPQLNIYGRHTWAGIAPMAMRCMTRTNVGSIETQLDVARRRRIDGTR